MEETRTIKEFLSEINTKLQLNVSEEQLIQLAEFGQLEHEAEKGSDRGVEIRLASDGSTDATYQDLSNLLRIDFAGAKDILNSSTNLAVAAGSAAAYSVSPWLLLLTAIYYFRRGTIIELHPSDAKTLYAILQIDHNRFSRQELNAAYEEAHQEPLDETTAGRSITRLMELGIIEHRGEQQYRLMTSLTLRRQ